MAAAVITASSITVLITVIQFRQTTDRRRKEEISVSEPNTASSFDNNCTHKNVRNKDNA